jgi:hypothetical protein
LRKKPVYHCLAFEEIEEKQKRRKTFYSMKEG